MSTILDILASIPANTPVICAPGRRDLDGRDLRTAVANFRAAVPGGLDDRRVAIIGPDTAETALVLLAVASTATAAPLNPQFTESEFAFEYRDLGVDLVLLHVSAPAPAMAAAIQLGLPVARYDAVKDAPAGIADIVDAFPSARSATLRQREGTAFVLHTSGTTSRPKIVPLLEDRIIISAENIARRLGLADDDRTLSIMPLFHVHGILTVFLTSLVSGASVSFAGVFDPTRVFEWLAYSRPTWLSAVPAMHNAILARAQIEGRTGLHGLRFVRASSAPLPMRTRAALERFYGVPVIEMYGMTEIEQIASQELPPAKRKAGSVGRSGGPRIRILTADGRDAPVGVVGEVCVSGPNCFPGYENNVAATQAAFVDGFFRTGDLGRLDEDAHLFLVGRAKEIIIRAGEKISPVEIEEAIGDHPGVAEVAAFAVPDAALGEEIGLAVIARDPVPTSAELVRHAARRLAPFKLPKKIIIVDSLPRGPTGKLQRRALSEMFARDLTTNAADASRDEPPRDALEATVAEVWSEVLKIAPIGRRTSFTSLGGSSEGAAKVLMNLERRLGRAIPLGLILKAETIEDVAKTLSATE